MAPRAFLRSQLCARREGAEVEGCSSLGVTTAFLF